MLPGQQVTILLVSAFTALNLEGASSLRRNFEARQSTNSNVPLWKQRVSHIPGSFPIPK